MKNNNYYNLIKIIEKIANNNSDIETKENIFKHILKLRNSEINIMITGATGSGKSSTINALFNMEVAKVGVGADPETMDIKKYALENMILWDSPGLGDGKENDNNHAKAIIKKLNELDDAGNPLIDLVLVILDGSTRDLGTSYELINTIIIPNLGNDAQNRLLVAINQADVAKKGRNAWDYERNHPTESAEKFLEEKVRSVKQRIKEATNIDIEPIYYSAGYKDEGEMQRPYNLIKLLYLIIKHLPDEKRLIIADNLSNDNRMWQDDDNIMDYREEARRTFKESARHVASTTLAGASAGAAIGSAIPIIGTAIGGLIGGVIGFFGGLFE